MNKIFLVLLASAAIVSCSAKNQVPLEKLTFRENIKDFFSTNDTYFDAREINTTLPMIYTHEVDGYNYGSVNFIKSDPNHIPKAKIGVLLSNPTDEQFVGLLVTTESIEASNAIFEELKTQMGTPEILSQEPEANENDQVLGYSAYLWRQKSNHSAILYRSYEHMDDKRNIASSLYLVSNKTKVTDPNQNELVVDRLIRTYK
ncbi:hypothetical protein [Denitromonas iodatirespirans]|uniref:Lipoprotein n=1 Tax=Denitromonas iodatirespirans TaxID=2795389 RepID=A0A944HDU6_DENI1|nr:hypothetical protein [Denitromonas iodatirespirans]MBT0964102.1 hypothetical protein [Denitromonas iodatirespirans]